MGTAPVADGSSGSCLVDKDSSVLSIAQWRLSSVSTFVGGLGPRFFRRIVSRLIELNGENLRAPSLDLTRVDFDGTTGKGTLGIVEEDGLAGSTLSRLRSTYPLFAASELSRCPKGHVVLALVPVFDGGEEVGALAGGLQPDDIVIGFGNPPEVVSVGDNAFEWLKQVYFREVSTMEVVYVRPSTMVERRATLRIGAFPRDRERVGLVDNYNLIDKKKDEIQEKELPVAPETKLTSNCVVEKVAGLDMAWKVTVNDISFEVKDMQRVLDGQGDADKAVLFGVNNQEVVRHDYIDGQQQSEQRVLGLTVLPSALLQVISTDAQSELIEVYNQEMGTSTFYHMDDAEATPLAEFDSRALSRVFKTADETYAQFSDFQAQKTKILKFQRNSGRWVMDKKIVVDGNTSILRIEGQQAQAISAGPDGAHFTSFNLDTGDIEETKPIRGLEKVTDVLAVPQEDVCEQNVFFEHNHPFLWSMLVSLKAEDLPIVAILNLASSLVGASVREIHSAQGKTASYTKAIKFGGEQSQRRQKAQFLNQGKLGEWF
jgi:hypothetical protein